MALVNRKFIPEIGFDRRNLVSIQVGRILGYLLAAESKAETVVERETYILARSVVRVASLPENQNKLKLNPDAFFWAFVSLYGSAPEVIARKAAHVRAFMLGRTVLGPVMVKKSAGRVLAQRVAVA